MDDKFGLKDSGQRRDFDTGSRRDVDTGKPRYDLLSTWANLRTAIHLAKGALKYGNRNWENGQPVSVLAASLMRHWNQYMQGERDEDHLAAVRFGIDAIMHFEELAKRGDPTALRMLDEYASAVLADEIRAEQDGYKAVHPVIAADAEYVTYVELEDEQAVMSDLEMERWLEGQRSNPPVTITAEDLSPKLKQGDRVVHKSGWEGRLTALYGNGDGQVQRDGDPKEIFYPAPLMKKNFVKVDDDIFGND